MIDPTRIASGFDVELQLGAGWFRTALDLLNEQKLLGPPGLPIVILGVEISAQPEWDLEIQVFGLNDPVLAKAELGADGKSLTLTTNMPQIPPKTIPFGVFSGLSGKPVKVKRLGDADHESVIALLANLKIHAEPQNEEPRDLDTDPLPRGNEADAVSFLPTGQHAAFGMSKQSFERFANNLWHSELRAEDGTHPLPDAENKKGTWSKVTMTASGGALKIKLEGDIPLDSPLIDIVPDPHVTITLNIKPVVEDGVLRFDIDPDTDVDTGLLGDIFGAITGGLGAGIVGGIIGFIVGLLTGGILAAVLTGFVIGAGIGIVAGVIAIEVAEVVVEGIVQREIRAKLDGQSVPELLCADSGLVQIARPDPEDAFDLSVLDSIPASVPIHTENPENEVLYKQSLLVVSLYNDVTANSDGFALAGPSATAEKFLPEKVSVKSFNYNGSVLESVTYKRTDNQEQTLPLAEVIDRGAAGELDPPLRLSPKPEKSTLRLPEGKLACVTLRPVAIHREDTIVTEIEFENGLRLHVPDAVALQEAGAIVVTGFQLIHPRNANPYFRAFADSSTENNFESLPRF